MIVFLFPAVVFSKFYDGFSVAARVDNVTKFQLFAEQRPLSETAIVPSPPPPPPVPHSNGFKLFAQFWATATAAARAKAESLKATCLKTSPQNYINLPDASMPTPTPTPWPKTLRFNAVCVVSLSLARSSSPSHSPAPFPLACTKHTPNAKRASTHVVHYYPLYANVNRITFNMLPDHN